jgi:hypothetical protein
LRARDTAAASSNVVVLSSLDTSHRNDTATGGKVPGNPAALGGVDRL